MSQSLDRWVSAEIRSQIENQFYARINEQAAFERLVTDPDFMDALQDHVALFSDHGVVHMRDVAKQLLSVLEISHGTLIPRRSPLRYARLCGYGVLIALLHDIGMVDFSNAGRSMHPEFAAQAVFDPALNPLIEQIWHENSANLAWMLSGVAKTGAPMVDPQLVLREMLALSMAHSKSKVPIGILNEPAALRRTLQEAVGKDLNLLYLEQRLAAARRHFSLADTGKRNLQRQLATAEASLAEYGGPTDNLQATRFYRDFAAESFAWLVSDHPALQALQADVVDAVRTLRAADALRQRGTYLKTSGNYEVLIDSRSGNAVFALRHKDDKLFLLELPDQISAGEANIGASELDAAGDLRINFNRGAFTAPGADDYAARCAALVVRDIQSDVVESFVRSANDRARDGLKPAASVRILLEETEDDPEFSVRVSQYLCNLEPSLHGRVGIVPSLQQSEDNERARYQRGQRVDWSRDQRLDLLRHLQTSGHRAETIDLQNAFEHVVLISLDAGDILIHAGAPAIFVYIPLGEGLRIVPLGGYRAFAVQPWMPLGTTGVIRGAARNATVVAETALQLLMIPKNVYLRHWHQTHTPATFRAAVAALLSDAGALPVEERE